MMIRLLINVLLFSAFALGQDVPNAGRGASTPVLVELFTAEGCATCSNADDALEFLRREQPVPGAEIVTLAFHVDYFDRFGWKDRFASREFTARQEWYAKRLRIGEVYTPQMIVDGRAEFPGIETGLATNAVLAAAKDPKGKVDLTLDGDVLKIVISDLPRQKDSAVFLAVTEDGLETDVSASTNRGRKLRHASVVREFRELGQIGKRDARSELSVDLKALGIPRGPGRRFVVFAQESQGGRIILVGLFG